MRLQPHSWRRRDYDVRYAKPAMGMISSVYPPTRVSTYQTLRAQPKPACDKADIPPIGRHNEVAGWTNCRSGLSEPLRDQSRTVSAASFPSGLERWLATTTARAELTDNFLWPKAIATRQVRFAAYVKRVTRCSLSVFSSQLAAFQP